MEPIISFFHTHNYLIHILTALLVLIATTVTARIIPVINRHISKRLAGRTKTSLDDELYAMLGSGLGKVVWLAGIYFIFEAVKTHLPEKILVYRSGILYVFLIFIVAHILSRSLLYFLDWYNQKFQSGEKGQYFDDFLPLFRRLIAIVIYTIALITLLHHFGQDVSSIVVSLGVGSLAVALAAKDTLANMIAGFMIMTDRPFRLGDRIQLENGEKGDVHDIGLRSTKILTFDNTLIVVPNQQIINEKVTNLSYPDPQIRVKVKVGVAYGSDLNKVKQIMIDACDKHNEVLDVPPSQAYFLSFGDSSLDLRLICRISRWEDQWRIAEELRLAIYQAFLDEGIEIPFPQRVVTMKK